MASNFDEKYKIKIVPRGDYYRGTYVIDGQSYRLDYSTKEEVLKHIESDIWHMARERRDSQTVIGRPKGSKNYKGRLYNEKDIKRLFNNVQAAVVGATIVARSATMDGLGEDLLRKVVADANFDDYTGNLAGSYHVTTVRNRRIVSTKSFPSIVKGYTFGVVRNGIKKGVRYARRRISRYHKNPSQGDSAQNKLGAKINIRDKRYLKKWEPKREGYRARFTPEYTAGENGANFSPGYLNRGSGQVRSGVLITNDAPYASAVERTPGRNVLRGSTAMTSVKGKWSRKAQSLARFASKSILQRTFGKKYVK
jgi:hypothetical protein